MKSYDFTYKQAWGWGLAIVAIVGWAVIELVFKVADMIWGQAGG